MLEYLTPQEIAEEAREALRKLPPETPREHFARLVRVGLIDTQGRVTRLYGGEAEPESDKADELLRQNGKPG
jgi:hypothetical protein